MDPTSACNLHCIGCWAAEYGNKLNLSLEELDSVIQQGKAMGAYFYIYSGGEPLVRKNDIITKVNEQQVGPGRSISTLIGEFRPGQTVRLTILRGDATLTRDLTLQAY